MELDTRKHYDISPNELQQMFYKDVRCKRGLLQRSFIFCGHFVYSFIMVDVSARIDFLLTKLPPIKILHSYLFNNLCFVFAWKQKNSYACNNSIFFNIKPDMWFVQNVMNRHWSIAFGVLTSPKFSWGFLSFLVVHNAQYG